MNIVKSITRREPGLEIIQDYDIALLRLKCYERDVYHGIAPNLNAPDFNPEPPVYACRFAACKGYEEILALANEDGKISLHDTRKRNGSKEPLEGTQAHGNAIFDIAWMPGEMKLVTASGDHTACLWDMSTSQFNKLETFHAHDRGIKSCVFKPEDKAVFATGARDGAIMIWDIRANHNDQPRPDNCIYNAHNITLPNGHRTRRTPSQNSRSVRQQSIIALAFQDDFTIFSCSSGDGLIKVWDLRKNYTVHKKDPIPKHTLHYGGKTARKWFTSLLVCPARITLYASCMDNVIYAYNLTSYNPKPVAEYFGHENSTFYVKSCLSPDGRYLASGSSDEVAYIWHTKKQGRPLLKLTGHTEEVTCVTWCNVGETKIVTCSDDSYHRIWRIGPEHDKEDEKMNIRGHAAPMPLFSPDHRTEMSAQETTPTVLRPYSNRDYYSSESDVTPGFDRPAKRSYMQMMSSSEACLKAVLSPIQENQVVSASKRPNLECRGARRLFSPGQKDEPKSLTNGYESDEAGPSSLQRLNGQTPFSPTLNQWCAPNFVVDGTAPHLLESSPEKCNENVDWLTRIRKERYAQSINKSTTERSASPRRQTTPARRTSRCKSTEPRKTPRSPASPLLSFFKTAAASLAAKDCDAKPKIAENTKQETRDEPTETQ